MQKETTYCILLATADCICTLCRHSVFFLRGATSPLKSPCLSRFLNRKNQAEYTATRGQDDSNEFDPYRHCTGFSLPERFWQQLSASQLELCSGGLCQKVAGERSNSAAISKRNFKQLGEDWAGKWGCQDTEVLVACGWQENICGLKHPKTKKRECVLCVWVLCLILRHLKY